MIIGLKPVPIVAPSSKADTRRGVGILTICVANDNVIFNILKLAKPHKNAKMGQEADDGYTLFIAQTVRHVLVVANPSLRRTISARSCAFAIYQ